MESARIQHTMAPPPSSTLASTLDASLTSAAGRNESALLAAAVGLAKPTATGGTVRLEDFAAASSTQVELACTGSTTPPKIPPRQKHLAVANLLYYNDQLKSMNELFELMLPYCERNGYFIMRNSFSKSDAYTVTVTHNKGLCHFQINQLKGQFYLQDRRFPSIGQLVEHYAKEDVPNIEGIKGIYLEFPITDMRRGRRAGNNTLPSLPSDVLSQASPRVSPMRKHSKKTQKSRLPELVTFLEQEEQLGAERCDCGLLASESQLPCGWTMHLSREPASRGRVFFMSSDEKTSWILPESVQELLTAEEWERLNRLNRQGHKTVKAVRQLKLAHHEVDDMSRLHSSDDDNHSLGTDSALGSSPIGDSIRTNSPLANSIQTNSPLGNSIRTHSPLGNSIWTHSPLGDSIRTHSPLDNTARNHSPLGDSIQKNSPLGDSIQTTSPLANSIWTHSPLGDSIRTHSKLDNTARNHSPLGDSIRTHNPLGESIRTHSPLGDRIRANSPLGNTIWTGSSLDNPARSHSPLGDSIRTHSPLGDRIRANSPQGNTIWIHSSGDNTARSHSPLGESIRTHSPLGDTIGVDNPLDNTSSTHSPLGDCVRTNSTSGDNSL